MAVVPKARIRAAIVSNGGCNDAAANTVMLNCWWQPSPHGLPLPQASNASDPEIATMPLITRQLNADVGGLDHRDGRHPGLQVELVHGLPCQQRDQSVRAGLDLDLGRDAILDHAGDDAGEAIAGRLRDKDLCLLLASRLRE